jgi:hypothetical protein
MNASLVAMIAALVCVCHGATNATTDKVPLEHITGTTARVDMPCETAATNRAAEAEVEPATNAPAKESTTEASPSMPAALGNGVLRALSRSDNPHTRPAPHGSVTTLRSSSGKRVGAANSYEQADGSTRSVIRDRKGHKVGTAHTYDTEIGRKTVLRDEDRNRIGSVHRVDGNTVYRDENNKRLTRREARARGLR